MMDMVRRMMIVAATLGALSSKTTMVSRVVSFLTLHVNRSLDPV